MRSRRHWVGTKHVVIAAAAALATAVSAAPAAASHSWGSYHWARQVNTFTLKLGDDVSSAWDSYLGVASGDWSKSTVLDTTVVSGLTTGRKCRPQSGRVEVCDAAYGNNGWLGLASIWAYGSHITQGTVKLNDTYFNTSTYNTPAWRQFVTCQEVGHTFGLDHQDENFNNVNLGTCMDYTNDPSSNQHPNQHDYDQLALIYSHLDASTTLAASSSSSGRGLKRVRDDVYVEDLGGGNKRFVFVFWKDKSVPHGPPADA